MKTIAAIVLLSCCAFGQDRAAITVAEAACGPHDAQFEVMPDDSRHPTPTPENNKSLIYVVERATGVMRFGADGKWLGALKPGTYFFASMEPGEHHLCVTGHSLYGRACPCTHWTRRRARSTTFLFVWSPEGATTSSRSVK